MKIGDIAKQTGVPARMIRYYESQGLLEPRRGTNGYRDYDEADARRVARIRNHIVAGLPTRLIKVVFDMEDPSWSGSCSQEFAAMLTDELAAIDERIACLSVSRQTLADYLTRIAPAS
jgi:DNA-binding transcriptional MerR regulator